MQKAEANSLTKQIYGVPMKTLVTTLGLLLISSTAFAVVENEIFDPNMLNNSPPVGSQPSVFEICNRVNDELLIFAREEKARADERNAWAYFLQDSGSRSMPNTRSTPSENMRSAITNSYKNKNTNLSYFLNNDCGNVLRIK
jgi:hypothetical protein